MDLQAKRRRGPCRLTWMQRVILGYIAVYPARNPPLTSPLLALEPQQWEDLCDRCGRCCLVKLQDEDTGELHYTNVACRHLDIDACRCTDYANRARINPRCVVLSPDDLGVLSFMPDTCAYRLVHEGRRPEADAAALSVQGRVVSEEFIHDEQIPEHIVEWVVCTTRSGR